MNLVQNVMLYQVIDSKGDLKHFEDPNLINGPIKIEYDVMKSALEGKVGDLKTYCKGDFGKLLLGIRPIIGIFKVYGRIAFKKRLCTLLWTNERIQEKV